MKPTPAPPGVPAPAASSITATDRRHYRQPRLHRRQRRRPKPSCMLPKGPKIAFSGGADLRRSQAASGRARQGARQASRHGADRMAARRRAPRKPPPAGPITARSRRSPSSPTGTADGKAAPFKRNDRMLDDRARRRHRLPGLRHHRQSRRQGQAARHPRSRSPQGGRRVSASRYRPSFPTSAEAPRLAGGAQFELDSAKRRRTFFLVPLCPSASKA